ncbi:hypothetical protein SCHPADRAFT_899691 [Schizopora paradoxa]|uniref:Uncharacterized protein n=1 Tax=Schizopora paradoxa TaxID=27342 RepID=A0A0H2SN31_9AGAM|nr:hypothetical protein SCHPADRAFT_899691 [Schizopora paradoxa]
MGWPSLLLVVVLTVILDLGGMGASDEYVTSLDISFTAALRTRLLLPVFEEVRDGLSLDLDGVHWLILYFTLRSNLGALQVLYMGMFW